MKSRYKSVLGELEKTLLMPVAFSSPGVDEVLHDTYRITRRIAQGGMGVLYEAEHLRLTDKMVAVKMLRPKALEDKHGFARFVREAYLVSSLGHPHIVYILDFNILESGQPYIVMELLEGESLQDRLRRFQNVLPLSEVLEIVRQAGSALQAIHQRGVVHRDLKPSNIFMLSGAGQEIHLKLIDFGISKVWSSGMTEVNVVLGSPFFMSPEQASGEVAQIDQRTDIFCLATVAYLCLCGVHPFSAPTVLEVRDRIIHQDPAPITELNPDLPGGLDRILARAMARAREDRYEDVGQFVADFIEASADAGGRTRQEDRGRDPQGAGQPPGPGSSGGFGPGGAPETDASKTSILDHRTYLEAASTALVKGPDRGPAPDQGTTVIRARGADDSVRARRRRRTLITLLAGAAGAAVVAGLVFGVAISPRRPAVHEPAGRGAAGQGSSRGDAGAVDSRVAQIAPPGRGPGRGAPEEARREPLRLDAATDAACLLTLVLRPHDARVHIDGVLRADRPVALPTCGEHRLEVSAGGYVTRRTRFVARPRLSLEVTLVPQEATRAVQTPPRRGRARPQKSRRAGRGKKIWRYDEL